jgi:PAS domain S-box-containing protein
MPSSIDLAARLSAVVTAQQDILAAVTDSDRVMQLVVQRIAEITQSDGAVIEIVDGDDMVYRAAAGNAAAHIGLRLAKSKSLSGRSVIENAVLRCDNVDLDPRVDGAACKAIGIRSMIVAPLLDGVEAIGALKTYSSRANAFEDLDAYTLQLFAGMTSSAMMLAGEFREHQASEERYRMLFERNVAGVFRTTRDGRILDCNDAFVRSLGYSSRAELLSHEAWELYHDRASREDVITRLDREGAMTNLCVNLKRRDGSRIIGLVNVSIIPGDEGPQLLGTMVVASEG